MKKGEKMSEEKREQIRLRMLGNNFGHLRKNTKHTFLSKERNRLSHLGMKPNENQLRGLSIGRYWNKGKKMPHRSGANHHNWKGGVTDTKRAIRASTEYKEWRRCVFVRDDYTCQSCSTRKGPLNADHELPFAFYPQLRFEVLNGRTLCKSCHEKLLTSRTKTDIYSPTVTSY